MTLFVLPQLAYWLFGLPENALGNFLAKRAGILFLGLSLLVFMARDTRSAEVIKLLAASGAVSMGAMALLGFYEPTAWPCGLWDSVGRFCGNSDCDPVRPAMA